MFPRIQVELFIIFSLENYEGRVVGEIDFPVDPNADLDL